MTNKPKRFARKPSENQALLSFRLPNALVDKLDAAAAAEGSSRTAVIRSALALYNRAAGQNFLLVPITKKTGEKLRVLVSRHECPAESLAERIFEQGIERAYEEIENGWRASVIGVTVSNQQDQTTSYTVSIKPRILAL